MTTSLTIHKSDDNHIQHQEIEVHSRQHCVDESAPAIFKHYHNIVAAIGNLTWRSIDQAVEPRPLTDVHGGLHSDLLDELDHHFIHSASLRLHIVKVHACWNLGGQVHVSLYRVVVTCVFVVILRNRVVDVLQVIRSVLFHQSFRHKDFEALLS